MSALPSDWKVVRAKYLFRRMSRDVAPDDGVVTAFRDGEVTLRSNRRTDGFTFAEKEIGYQGVEPGDLVIHGMDAFAGAIGVSDSRGKSSPVYSVCNPAKGVDSHFYAYLLRDFALSGRIKALAKGIRERSTDFRYNVFGEMELPVPPARSQRAIATHLDRETARIDTLIGKKERLLALLEEKRTALITRAVTRGLDPDVPMKDSGVEWLGEVPAHWEVRRMRHVCEDAIAGPFGSSLTKEMYGGDRYRVYGQQQVISGDFCLGDYFIPQEAYERLRRFSVGAGDLLVSCMGTVGRSAVVPIDAEPGIINPRLVRLRVRPGVSPEFLRISLASLPLVGQVNAASRGGTMEGLNLSIILSLFVAVPPYDEQLRITHALQDRGLQLDRLTGTTTRAITLLREYRSALISAAITGQLPIPEPHAATGSPSEEEIFA